MTVFKKIFFDKRFSKKETKGEKSGLNEDQNQIKIIVRDQKIENKCGFDFMDRVFFSSISAWQIFLKENTRL